MRTLVVFLVAGACAARPSDPAAQPAHAGQSDVPTEIRWNYAGPLRAALSFDMEVAPGDGALLVELIAELDVAPGPAPGLLTVDYEVTEVDELLVKGVLAEGPAPADRRAALLELSHHLVVDGSGAFQEGSEPLTDAEHEALGPGLHVVDQFLTLPYVPPHDPDKYTLEVDGHTARYSGHDIQDAVENYDGVTAELHSETTWRVVADLAASRPLERSVDSTALARYEDGTEEKHRGHARLRFSVPR